MADTVQTGIYFSFTLAEMETELARYKAAVKTQSAQDVKSFSVNGQSYSFGPNNDLTLQQWQKEIQGALAQVDPESYPLPSGMARATF